jgi:hypothetical protein
MDYSKLSREELLRVLGEDTVDIGHRIGAKAELGRRDRAERKRTRGNRWTAAGAVFTFMCLLAALFNQEFRRLVRLDTPTAPRAAEPQVRPPAEPPIQSSAHNPQPSLRVELRLMIGGYELRVTNEGQALAHEVNVDAAAWQHGAPGIEFLKSYQVRDLIPRADATVYSIFNPPQAQEPEVHGAVWRNDLFSRDQHYEISGYIVVTCSTCSNPRAWAFYVPPEGVSRPKESQLSKEMYSKYTGQRHPWPLAEFHYPEDKPLIGECVDFPRGVCGTEYGFGWAPR